jgi:hypothetical protein
LRFQREKKRKRGKGKGKENASWANKRAVDARGFLGLRLYDTFIPHRNHGVCAFAFATSTANA